MLFLEGDFCKFCFLTEVIPTSPDCAPLAPDVRGEAKVGPGCRGSRTRVGGGREGGRGAVCVYLPVFWVGFCLCFGETRASFPRNTGVSTCGAARPGAPPTTPLLLLLLQEPHNPVYARSQRGEPVPLLALPVSLHFGPGPVRLRSWRSSNRETGWTRAASYSEASAAFTAQTELGINSYCIKNYT